jgi:hypothetical protein
LTEYAKENKQSKLTIENFKADMIEEQAKATEELIAVLTEKHTQQMETLIKSTIKAMKEMMSLIKNDKKEPNSHSKLKRRRSKKKGTRNTMTHLSARTAEQNIQPKCRMSTGSSRRTRTPANPTESQ